MPMHLIPRGVAVSMAAGKVNFSTKMYSPRVVNIRKAMSSADVFPTVMQQCQSS